MRRYFVFATVSMGLLLSSITVYSGSVALPVITTDLQTSLIMAGWVLSVYSLVRTIAMPLTGKLSEVLGAKNTFVACVALFCVGSVLCALAPNVYLLIAARVFQAIGGGGFMPCAAGIVSETFPENRQRFIGLFTSINPIGMIIGPSLGGWLVEVFGWRSIFWYDVPLGIIVLILAIWLLPTGKKNPSTRIDFVGAGLLLGSLTALLTCLTEFGNKSGIPWVSIIILFVVGVTLMVIFVRWEHRVKEPFIDLGLLKQRPFMAANIYNIIYGACSIGILSLVPLYAVSVYKMSILQSGFLLTPRSLGMIGASTVTAFFLVKWGYRWPIIIGTMAMALGLALLALEPSDMQVLGIHISSTAFLFVIVGLCGIGSGICSPGSNNACIELMPDKVGTIIGIRGMFRQLGSSVGIAFATVIPSVIGDVRRAFFVVFIAAAVLAVLSLPAIFAMPATANAGITKQSK
jgi:EmrB/QacA subfamily drug resistance transporter